MLAPSPSSHDAEVEALRETVARLYDQLAQWDHHVHGRLRELQEQMAVLEAGRTVPDATPASQPVPLPSAMPYREMIRRIRHVVQDTLPAGAAVLVVSRGDADLLTLPERQGLHFPQQDDGVYAGYHPADSAAAIAHLERLRMRGADYLLIPQTSLWWLDYYTEFARHLQSRYEVVFRQDDLCRIIDLKRNSRVEGQPAPTPESRAYQVLRDELHALVGILLPADASVLVLSKGDDLLVQRCGPRAEHFPQEQEGGYAGYYPADSEAAIAHLEELRQRGAAFLLFPQPAFWWLDHYRGFREHLRTHYPIVCRQEHLCLIFDLARPLTTEASSPIDSHPTLKPW